MKAIELTGTVDEQGNLLLDQAASSMPQGPVRVIVLYPEDHSIGDVNDPDDTPMEEVKASLKQALEEAKSGQRIPLSQLWEGIDA
ncbi:hypothetical protein IQ254_28215 [Nodosilinea sp. LEGE 07088]|uniref:type II toxin-antitoxin system RelN family antitoxin n=1 Tax=Nodosilinea sp. LEGE 07088 TaxID=2777968 RepID=UPI0018809D30|nr:hypothetical protein [Nodosilinea sp. LEGE 07088]MBE9141038.1 hypothetical protein [Nodosilinea sp. LEGE 07088]